MDHPDSDDTRLRSVARTSLARLEAGVDGRAGLLALHERLDSEPSTEAIRQDSRHRARQVVAAAAIVMIAGTTALLIVHRGGPQANAPAPIGSSVTETAVSAATTAPTSTSEAASLAPPELVALFGKTWVIVSASGRPRSFAGSFTMNSGKAIGHDGCNFYAESIQLASISNGESSFRVAEGESTAAPCAPPYTDGWRAPDGRYRVVGNELTITADGGTIFDAVDLASLPTVASADDVAGIWSVPDGPSLTFADDGTIRLPCATIGTWTFDNSLHTTIDQAAASAGCTDAELRPLGWTYDALLSGAPEIHELPDGSLLFGSSPLGRIVRPTSPPMGSLLRPYVDPALCTPLSANGDGDATGSTLDLHLFAFPTNATSFPIQIIGDPNGGPTAPFALVQRYTDRLDVGLRPTMPINDWDVALDVGVNGNGDARWALPDGGMGYVRSRGIDRDTLIAVVSSLATRDSSAAIAGFDFTPGSAVPPTLQLLVEHLNTGVFGRSATLTCQVAATNFIYRISTLDGDPLFLYALVIDRPVPLQVAFKDGTLVVIGGNADPTAPTVDDVFNTDQQTWDVLRGAPPP